jgi:hypothetical protein
MLSKFSEKRSTFDVDINPAQDDWFHGRNFDPQIIAKAIFSAKHIRMNQKHGGGEVAGMLFHFGAGAVAFMRSNCCERITDSGSRQMRIVLLQVAILCTAYSPLSCAKETRLMGLLSQFLEVLSISTR